MISGRSQCPEGKGLCLHASREVVPFSPEKCVWPRANECVCVGGGVGGTVAPERPAPGPPHPGLQRGSAHLSTGGEPGFPNTSPWPPAAPVQVARAGGSAEAWRPQESSSPGPHVPPGSASLLRAVRPSAPATRGRRRATQAAALSAPPPAEPLRPGLCRGPVVLLLRTAPTPTQGTREPVRPAHPPGPAGQAGPVSSPLCLQGLPRQGQECPSATASASAWGPSTGMQPAPCLSPRVPGLPPVFNISTCSRQAAPRVPCSMG